MIVSELYDGQGFGNQLWSYVFTRVLALDKETQFGLQSPEKFKGLGFLDLDMGQQVTGGSGPEGGPPTELPDGIEHYYSERVILHPELDVDIRVLDSGFQEVIDNTKIEGIFQAEDYIAHRKEDIRRWLRYEPKQLDIDFRDPDICVINFRGGEYKGNPKIFLRRKYWMDAVAHIKCINPKVKFVVITDDPPTARRFFPKYPIRHYGIHGDYQAINTATYLIVSNSSFAFFPAWLNSRAKICVAPKFWAAHNESDGYWGCSYNIVRDWTYLDRDGSTCDFDECIEGLAKFQQLHSNMYEQKKISGALVVVSSFNNDLSWLPRYSDDYLVFEQGSGSGIPPQLDRMKLRFMPYGGSNFRDYFSYIIDHYDSLPEVVFLIKGNVFPRHVRQHIFDRFVFSSAPCSISDPSKHLPHFPLGYFDKSGKYKELNRPLVGFQLPAKYFYSLNDFFYFFDSQFTPKIYSRFSIGGQFVTTREQLQIIPKSIYKILLEIVSHNGRATGYTLESLIIERAIDRLWIDKKFWIPEASSLNLILAKDAPQGQRFGVRLLLVLMSFIAKNSPIRLSKFLWKASTNRVMLLRNFITH